jgi:tetratricopeptide (TPR) repeat protein
MTLITLRERGTKTDSAVITFEGSSAEFPVTISDPFSADEEKRLEWYFEQHLRFPFTDGVKAAEAAQSVQTYGERLFAQVLKGNVDAYVEYKTALRQGVERLRFEILGSPDFHRLHWEALKDPDLRQPFAVQCSMVRKNLERQAQPTRLRESPTINLLVVTARPHGEKDVAYRTISRPLIEALRRADLPVRVELVRPGSYSALSDHLEAAQDRHGAGYYHVVHFDLHGALLPYEDAIRIIEKERREEATRVTYQQRWGRPDLHPYDGLRGFLSFEPDPDHSSGLTAAEEIAGLLTTHGVPVAILNACQSGKQVSDSETSLGSYLLRAGVQTVLAMGYSVTVSAAQALMTELYRHLFARQDLPAAVSRGRLALFNDRRRRAYYNQTIDLEDWLLPVLYQNQAVQLTPRPFTAAEEVEFHRRRGERYRPPHVTYGFVGRDVDILHIERKLLMERNLLLVRGMGGAGKSTLLHHLAEWWQTTELVDQVFYFGYDERAWTSAQIMDAIAARLFDEAAYRGRFQPQSPAVQRSMLGAELRRRRHLLILDNLESITGSHLAIQNTLPADERAALHRLLEELAGGQTLVLLGSRGGEAWLAPATFEENRYDLPGLDPEAASALADKILARHQATQYRQDPALRRLLTLLDGYPLALEVALANLARQTPQEVLDALQVGDVGFDRADTEDKTKSVIACIAYSHSNLSPAAQDLLLCLAPFTGVINLQFLPQYTEQLKAEAALAHLPFDGWQAVLQEAANWGLISQDPRSPRFLRLQPTFPYFLRSRLEALTPRPPLPGKARGSQSVDAATPAAPSTVPSLPAGDALSLSKGEARGEFSAAHRSAAHRSAAIHAAFHRHYDGIGGALGQLIKSKNPQERQLGMALVSLEYENLQTAVEIALAAKSVFYNAYEALFRYLDTNSMHERAAALSQQVLAAQPSYAPEEMTADIERHFYLVYARLATSQLMLKRYTESQDAYKAAIAYIDSLRSLSKEVRANYLAGTYHNLGIVAQAQRQWAQAEGYYRQALDLFIEFNDRYSQASTYHQLGMVAQAQRQWAQAEGYYRQALDLKIEFNDRYSQASTYHHLGMVAEEQRQWAQAEGYYRQALDLKIEFNDRYSQASTYHQLGIVAQAQRQWAQARDYLMQDLTISAEFNDEHGLGITLRTLARLWKASGDADLPAAVAAVLGVPPGEVAAMFAQVE